MRITNGLKISCFITVIIATIVLLGCSSKEKEECKPVSELLTEMEVSWIRYESRLNHQELRKDQRNLAILIYDDLNELIKYANEGRIKGLCKKDIPEFVYQIQSIQIRLQRYM